MIEVAADTHQPLILNQILGHKPCRQRQPAFFRGGQRSETQVICRARISALLPVETTDGTYV